MEEQQRIRQLPKTAYQIGHTPWIKGKRHNEMTRLKMKSNHKGMSGKKHSEETKKKISQILKGKKHSQERRKQRSQYMRKYPLKYWLGKKRDKRISGKNCHFWKGGKTKLQWKIRKCFEYRQWRSDIFTRDDYTCRKCGERGCYLEADHYPKKFSDILDEYNIKTLEEALSCEELWNLNNGRTLCIKCHQRTKNGRITEEKTTRQILF